MGNVYTNSVISQFVIDPHNKYTVYLNLQNKWVHLYKKNSLAGCSSVKQILKKEKKDISALICRKQIGSEI